MLYRLSHHHHHHHYHPLTSATSLAAVILATLVVTEPTAHADEPDSPHPTATPTIKGGVPKQPAKQVPLKSAGQRVVNPTVQTNVSPVIKDGVSQQPAKQAPLKPVGQRVVNPPVQTTPPTVTPKPATPVKPTASKPAPTTPQPAPSAPASITPSHSSQPSPAQPAATVPTTPDDSTDKQSNITQWMKNYHLRLAIRDELRVELKQPNLAETDITKTVLAQLRTLNNPTTIYPDMPKFSLEGLEYATNLQVLRLRANDNTNDAGYDVLGTIYGNLYSLEPLRDPKYFKYLSVIDFRGNRVTDISPLASHTSLTEIDAQNNGISDFRPLKRLFTHGHGPTINYGLQLVYEDTPVRVGPHRDTATLQSKCYDVTSKEPLNLKQLTSISDFTTPVGQIQLPKVTGENGNNMDNYINLNQPSAISDITENPSKHSIIFHNLQFPLVYIPHSKFLPQDRQYYLMGYYNQKVSLTDPPVPHFLVIQRFVIESEIPVDYRDTANHPLIDLNGQPVHTETVLGTPDDVLDLPPKTIPGWHCISSKPTHLSIEGKEYSYKPNPDAKASLTYFYSNNAGTVTIHYLDETGHPLAPTLKLAGTGQLDRAINATVPTFSNFEMTHHQGALTYTWAAHDLTYFYRRKTAGDVTVRYQDETGSTLLDPQHISGAGALGLPVLLSPKTIANFHFQGRQGTPVFTVTPHDLIMIYTRDDAQDVKVHYQDTTGHQVYPVLTLPGRGKLGLAYQTSPATVPGYDLIIRPVNASGYYRSTSQQVIYTYVAIPTIPRPQPQPQPKPQPEPNGSTDPKTPQQPDVHPGPQRPTPPTLPVKPVTPRPTVPAPVTVLPQRPRPNKPVLSKTPQLPSTHPVAQPAVRPNRSTPNCSLTTPPATSQPVRPVAVTTGAESAKQVTPPTQGNGPRSTPRLKPIKPVPATITSAQHLPQTSERPVSVGVLLLNCLAWLAALGWYKNRHQ